MSDLDDTSLQALARSFYVVRMVRYALLVVFLVGFAVLGVAAGHGAVAAVLGAAALLLLVKANATHRRYVTATRAPGPASAP